jgi:hypothetical protein
MPSPANDFFPEPPRPATPGGLPSLGKSPIHLLSALVTVSVDKLWELMLLDMAKGMSLYDKNRFFLIVGLLLLILTTVSTTMTQRLVDNDAPGAALAKGVAMGVLAGLPYSFSSTEMGLLFIGWSGINELQKQHKQQRQMQEQEQETPQPLTAP